MDERVITKEPLVKNGWQDKFSYANISHPDGWYAEYRYGRNSLSIWEEKPDDAYNADVFVRVVNHCICLRMAFALCGITYKLE